MSWKIACSCRSSLATFFPPHVMSLTKSSSTLPNMCQQMMNFDNLILKSQGLTTCITTGWQAATSGLTCGFNIEVSAFLSWAGSSWTWVLHQQRVTDWQHIREHICGLANNQGSRLVSLGPSWMHAYHSRALNQCYSNTSALPAVPRWAEEEGKRCAPEWKEEAVIDELDQLKAKKKRMQESYDAW